MTAQEIITKAKKVEQSISFGRVSFCYKICIWQKRAWQNCVWISFAIWVLSIRKYFYFYLFL